MAAPRKTAKSAAKKSKKPAAVSKKAAKKAPASAKTKKAPAKKAAPATKKKQQKVRATPAKKKPAPAAKKKQPTAKTSANAKSAPRAVPASKPTAGRIRHRDDDDTAVAATATTAPSSDVQPTRPQAPAPTFKSPPNLRHPVAQRGDDDDAAAATPARSGSISPRETVTRLADGSVRISWSAAPRAPAAPAMARKSAPHAPHDDSDDAAGADGHHPDQYRGVDRRSPAAGRHDADDKHDEAESGRSSFGRRTVPAPARGHNNSNTNQLLDRGASPAQRASTRCASPLRASPSRGHGDTASVHSYSYSSSVNNNNNNNNNNNKHHPASAPAPAPAPHADIVANSLEYQSFVDRAAFTIAQALSLTGPPRSNAAHAAAASPPLPPLPLPSSEALRAIGREIAAMLWSRRGPTGAHAHYGDLVAALEDPDNEPLRANIRAGALTPSVVAGLGMADLLSSEDRQEMRDDQAQGLRERNMNDIVRSVAAVTRAEVCPGCGAREAAILDSNAAGGAPRFWSGGEVEEMQAMTLFKCLSCGDEFAHESTM